ncbi:hypothetical protein KJ657_01900 [Patescibacteria group bacterium]|nr:hypothetical protein [Patescibacteria group bacterium]MBU1015821.1 hypothetical protein [Patescibacteria group bacterium]MBU1685240.1 hypothetical protein [Patescibacteria group bacterium]MBU1938249.1 hypothetical protein [Patescibacteria group bacterium]
MNLRRIKHTLLRLTAEEKVIGIGSLAMLIGTFMPWYSVVMNFDNKSLTETGFSGDLGVIGFVIFIMSLISLIVLVAENMRLPLPQFSYKREQILFFFLGEAFFLTLLTMAIYTKRSLEFTEAGLRFGIYLALLGSFLGALSAFALMQKQKKNEVQAFFSHEQKGEEDDVEEEEVTETLTKKEMTQLEPEPMYFEEDAETIEAIEEVVESEASDYIPEDEMIEEVREEPKSAGKQADYFTREAGVEKPHEKPKSGGKMSMGFYEDK